LHNLEPPVIYRDLKPSNIMLMPSGLVKLIDFGIARLFQPLSNATMIGTQGYAPPEQYRGKVESRSDLYALGATMHHALSGRDPALEPPFSFPPLRSVAPEVTPALAATVDQALQYDVILRMADAQEFKSRLLAIKNGTTSAQAPILTRNSLSTGTAAATDTNRPQLKLPLTGLQYKQSQSSPASPSAPTVLSDAIDAQCPRCGREIPLDSNFCSFCAADVTGRLQGVANASPDAQTIFLDEPSEPMSFPEREDRPRRRKRNPLRVLFYVIGGAFLAGYLMFRPSSQPDTDPTSYVPPGYGGGGGAPGGDGAPGGGSAPDAPEPAPSEARTIALRRALNQMGYQSVHFKLDGDTIILWGTVPTEADRIMVQTQVFLVARIFSLEDHLQVRDAFAEP
jgi:serine/threonine protein kinase